MEEGRIRLKQTCDALSVSFCSNSPLTSALKRQVIFNVVPSTTGLIVT